MSGEKFADHQAAEIHRLRRLVDRLQHQLWHVRRSRELWRERAREQSPWIRKEKR